MSVPPDDEMEVVLLYQPIVREEARHLAQGLRAFHQQARSLRHWPGALKSALVAAADSSSRGGASPQASGRGGAVT